MATTTKTLKGTITSTVGFSGDGTSITNTPTNVTGSANAAAVFNSSGKLTYEPQLLPRRGGTGLNTSASTGAFYISSGTWNVSATLPTTYGGTGLNTSSSTGIIYANAGTWTVADTMPRIRGGIGTDTSSSTCVPCLIAGTWNTSNANLIITYGGTNLDTTGVTGVPVSASNSLSVLGAYLSASKGGTGVNSSTWTGVPYITSGTWANDTNFLTAAHGGTGYAITTQTGYVTRYNSDTDVTWQAGLDMTSSCHIINYNDYATTSDGTLHTNTVRIFYGTHKKSTVTGMMIASAMVTDGSLVNFYGDSFVQYFHFNYKQGTPVGATSFVADATANIVGLGSVYPGGTTDGVGMNYQGVAGKNIKWTFMIRAVASHDTTVD
jgi:hypothetical protein